MLSKIYGLVEFRIGTADTFQVLGRVDVPLVRPVAEGETSGWWSEGNLGPCFGRAWGMASVRDLE